MRKDFTYTATAGFKVGLIILDTSHPILPGNVQNATSFDFPVLYETVSSINSAQLMQGDPACDIPISKAIKSLEKQGVSAVLGACGSFANWQKRATYYTKVPVYLSIMTQVPFILASLPQTQKLGVVYAFAAAYTDRVKSECNITDDSRLIVFGAEEALGFKECFAQGATIEGGRKFEQSIVDLCVRKKKEHPEIGGWLFQCSELPVYAAAIQSATGLAVYDQTLLIAYQYAALSRTVYE